MSRKQANAEWKKGLLDGRREGLELECADVLPALGAGGGLSGDPAMSEP